MKLSANRETVARALHSYVPLLVLDLDGVAASALDE